MQLIVIECLLVARALKTEWADRKQVPASKGLHPRIELERVRHAWDLGQTLVGEPTDG